MKTTNTFIFTLLVLTMIITEPIPIAASNTFQYALNQQDLPSGFVLEQSSGTEYYSNQFWNTPSDSSGSTQVSVTKYNSTTDIEADWNFTKIFGQPITFKGADESLNVTFFGTSFWAKKGLYLVEVVGPSVFSDIKILMEDQLTKLPGHKSAPGFSLLIVLLSFSVLGLILTRKRKL